MYERIDQFQAAAFECGTDYYTDGSLHEDKIGAAFRIYRNASAGTRLSEFHFASPLRWENLWDERGKQMTVTAREVIGITAFGFRISRPILKLEAVAQCTDENKAAAASLPAYKKEVRKYQAIGTFQKFYETIPEAARQ